MADFVDVTLSQEVDRPCAGEEAIAGAEPLANAAGRSRSPKGRCATVPRARVLRSCIHALRDVPGQIVGETTIGDRRISLARGHGLPPGAAATGHINAMAMYAGESVTGIDSIESVAEVLTSWCAAIDNSN